MSPAYDMISNDLLCWGHCPVEIASFVLDIDLFSELRKEFFLKISEIIRKEMLGGLKWII